MNKKFVNVALVSLLFCTVHNSNGKPKVDGYPVHSSRTHSNKEEQRTRSKRIAAGLSTIHILVHSENEALAEICAANLPRLVCQDKDEIVLKNSFIDGVGEVVFSFLLNSFVNKLGSKFDDFAGKKEWGKELQKCSYQDSLKKMTPGFLVNQRGNIIHGGSAFVGIKAWNLVKKQLVSQGWCDEISDDDDNSEYKAEEIKFSFNPRTNR